MRLSGIGRPNIFWLLAGRTTFTALQQRNGKSGDMCAVDHIWCKLSDDQSEAISFGQTGDTYNLSRGRFGCIFH